MKIFIAIAVILNVYGVLSEPHIFHRIDSLQPAGDPHPRRHHEHHRHHRADTSVLTTDDLADVLLSLPGSLGRAAYKTFLALGQFLPADTKAHKFFTSIPKAIKRKSNDQFTDMPTMPTMPRAPLSPNSMFMMQPAGYHMVPLPLHPMFSSSPLDYVTRVPCRHTKIIRVPLHTFDVQISAITRKFNPPQSAFDESEDEDEDDDEMDSGLKDLLDTISSDTEDDDEVSEGSESDDDLQGKKSSEEVSPGTIKPDDEPGTKKDDAPKTDETPVINKEDPASKTEEKTPPTESTEEKPQETIENSADATLSKVTEAEPSTMEKPASETEEVSSPTPAQPIEETAPVKEEGLTAKEVESMHQEASQQNENPLQESVESPPAAADKFDKKKKKKAPAKKGKKAAAEAEAESALEKKPESEPEPAAAAPAKDDDLMEEVSKPILTKKGKKKRQS